MLLKEVGVTINLGEFLIVAMGGDSGSGNYHVKVMMIFHSQLEEY